MDKASNWKNATVVGTIVTIIEPSDDITYDYQVKEGQSKTFSLKLAETDAEDVSVNIPTGLGATVKDTTSIALNWEAAEGADGYEVCYSASESGKYTLLDSTTETSYTHKSLTIGQTYYYKVHVYKIVNGKTYYSSDTDAVSCKIPVSKPTGLTLSVASASYSMQHLKMGNIKRKKRSQESATHIQD